MFRGKNLGVQDFGFMMPIPGFRFRGRVHGMRVRVQSK